MLVPGRACPWKSTATAMADGAEGGAEPPVPLGTRVVVNGRYKGTLRFFGEVGYAPGAAAPPSPQPCSIQVAIAWNARRA